MIYEKLKEAHKYFGKERLTMKELYEFQNRTDEKSIDK